MQSTKYLNLVQCNIDEFNAEQNNKRKLFGEEFGARKLSEIMWGKTHHELKASRTVDYSLTKSELEELESKGILFKETKEKSFARNYLELYNNDMPVMITNDSMLYPFHKFYDNFLKNLEEKELTVKLIKICKTMLDNLYTITPNEENYKMLAFIELILIVPYLLLKMNNELTPENCNLKNEISTLPEDLRTELLNYKPSYKLRVAENEQGFKINYQFGNSDTFTSKLKIFNEINKLPEDFETEDILFSSPKFNTIFSKFNMPNLDEPIVLKYSDYSLLEDIFSKIANSSKIQLLFQSIKVDIDGSLFKPRGHYGDTLGLKKYFMAFTWLSKFQINFKKSVDECLDELLLSCCFSKIAEIAHQEVKEFEDFIAKIIGEPDGYTLISFLNEINDEIPKMDLNSSISWIYQNMKNLVERCKKNLIKRNKLTQFGDTVNHYNANDHETTLFSFSVIGKGNQIDNLIIQKMVDRQLVDDKGSIPLRKFTSVFDLVYLLFDNKDVKEVLGDRMDNIYHKNRDGFKYNNHLDKISKELETVTFDNTIYAQELKMLRALALDRELMKKKNFYPFNTSNWMKKQAQTQIAHYAELRHDNVLYLEELGGMMSCCCAFPDLLVEPVPNFWKEFLVLVNMMQTLCKGPNDILDNFSTIITKFIKYLDDLLEHGKIDLNLEKELKLIIHEQPEGSGSIVYKGWYMKLYKDSEDAFEFKPEVSSMFSASDDTRGDGGVVHLGTGPVQIMYLLVKDFITGENKIMLGPTYSAYEFITQSSKRLNDDEWKQEYKKYQKISLISKI